MSLSLLSRVAIGDRAAVDDCVTHYGGLLWSLARRHSPDLASAEDAVQEIFVDIWKNAARFDVRQGSELTFVAMLARRRLVDRRRRDARSVPTTPLDRSLEVPAKTGIDRLVIQEQVDQARQGIAELRAEERQVLELALDHGLSSSEIAARLSLPLGTVKSLARRGMQRLRDLLGHSRSQTMSTSENS